MNKPTISIIMSTHNNAAYIEKTLDSVLRQTFSDWEFIIVNDASTDRTGIILNRYLEADKRIKVYTNLSNQGLVSNLIKGASLAKGKYLARIDGDDIWVDQNKLNKQAEFMHAHPEYSLVGTFAYIVDTKGNILFETKNPVNDEEIRNYILIENCFFHSSVLIRKSVFDRVGGYNKNLKATEDYEAWLKMGLVSKLYNIPEYMIHYRVNPDGINSTKYNLQLQETISIVKVFKHSYPNYRIGISFWYLRKYVPGKIKTAASEIMKSKFALKSLRQTKKMVLSFHS